MIIYTYGGGDILYNLFQGIAKLHNGGFLKTLFAIGGMVGFTLAMLKTFFSNQSIGELVRSWFLPLVIGYGLIFLPRTHIMIKDIVTQNTKSVDNVPYGLSLIASLTSKIGYTITEGIETVLHTSHSPTYNKTGHIFAGEHMMDIANYTWENPTTEQNMRNFVVNCITYDVMLGRYSLDKLRSSNDLWPYIKERTSKNRGIYWIEASESPHTKEPKYCSCRDAAVKLNDLMNSEVTKKQKNDLFKNLPGAFQALTAKSNAATTLLRQQLMLHSLVDGVESKASSLGLGHDFAVQRAYLQQQSTMHIAGGLAGKSVVIIRAIFEALILVSFIFVIPMLAFPNGLTFFGRWAEMVVWINFWPPIYAVLNFILQSAAQSRAAAIGTDLTLSTATPLANLYQDMVAYAGWASKEPWAEGVRQDMMNEFQSSIEKDAIAKMDTRISSEGGFHGSTSQLQKNYDSSVSNMKQPSRDSFADQSGVMSSSSGLEGSAQHISENKASLVRQGSDNSGAIQNNLTDRSKEMGKAKADMKEEFQENKDEWVGTKTARATTTISYGNRGLESKKKD